MTFAELTAGDAIFVDANTFIYTEEYPGRGRLFHSVPQQTLELPIRLGLHPAD